MKPAFRSLGLKLVVSLVASLSIILSLASYHLTELHRQSLEDITYLTAGRISDSIESSILYSMQRNHRDEIYHAIQTIGQEPGIDKVRIFNEVGRISFSSDNSEINTLLDKQAEACYACHAQEQPLSHLEQPDRQRIYLDSKGHRVLGVINAIENRPQCWSAQCHAHSEEQRILGVLDVNMSLEHIDRIIQQDRRQMILSIAFTTLMVSIVLGVLVWWMAHRPIKELMKGTELVAKGNLQYRIPGGSNDDMGALGASFNRMTGELQQAQLELKSWAETLEKRVEEKAAQLREANHQLIQVERMASMGKLAAIVAHEINNPLTGILTSARLILKRISKNQSKESFDPEAVQLLELIAGEAARCGEIVKNLLQFARPKKRHPTLNRIEELVQDALRLVQHKLDLSNIKTVVSLDVDLPPIRCDGPEIRQVLVAVLINAIEAIGAQGGTISIRSSYRSKDEVIELSIEDTGCGMSAGVRARIFEPFFSTKEEVKGVGIGLAVASGIIQAHGGSIEIESEPGLGTTLIIRMPREPQQAGSDSGLNVPER